jgi:hypothetical protein
MSIDKEKQFYFYQNDKQRKYSSDIFLSDQMFFSIQYNQKKKQKLKK